MSGKYLLSLLLFLSVSHFSLNQLYAQGEEGEIVPISERVGEEIDREDSRKDVHEELAMAEEKPRDLKNESYPELGVVCSVIMSPTAGYWFGPVGVKVAGMYLGDDRNEFHLNLRYKFSDNEKTQHSINLVSEKIVGSDPGADYDFTCLGLAYGLNFSIKGYGGFYIEMGMAKVLHDNLGNLENDPFVPCGTFGYIYRFTPK